MYLIFTLPTIIHLRLLAGTHDFIISELHAAARLLKLIFYIHNNKVQLDSIPSCSTARHDRPVFMAASMKLPDPAQRFSAVPPIECKYHPKSIPRGTHRSNNPSIHGIGLFVGVDTLKENYQVNLIEIPFSSHPGSQASRLSR